MRKKYSYYEKYSGKIEQYLAEKEIKYKIIGDDHIVPKMISFTVYDNTVNDINHIIKHGKPIISNEFTKTEIQSADYLTLRAVKQVVEIANTCEAFSYKCPRKTLGGWIKYEHKEQIGEIMLKKMFNAKGTTCFYSSTNGFSELFVKEDVYALLQKEGISGISFLPVNVPTAEQNKRSGLLQLFAQSKIKKEAINFGTDQIKMKCPICGREKVVCSQDYQLRLVDSLDNYSEDFYMTDAVFGEGFSHPVFVISKKFYTTLDSYKLASNIVLEPVIFENRKHILSSKKIGIDI